MSVISTSSHPIQVEHLYAISKSITQTLEWKRALDDISNLVRKIFIFDNLVVYRTDPNQEVMEAVYARATGRGRSAEADSAWGETAAYEAVQSQKTVLTDPVTPETANRLERPYVLGIPLSVGPQVLGAIIFIRFGGPVFTPESIELAEYISRQITLLIERQRIQEEYQILEDQHKQSRLQQDFVSTISHELRNPLGFIKGYTTTLLRSDTQWDQVTQVEFLKIIDQETDHMQELIENLLDSARLQAGQLRFQFQLVRLESLMNDVITRANLHHPDLVFNLEIPQALNPIVADPVRLAQVIENLISNAIKYAPGSDISITINQEDKKSIITFSDHGPGISEHDLPFIFDRFYRSSGSPTIHGSGLGLYICKHIIQAHHGELSARSKVNEGTSFTIILPGLP
ncbi:MAG TPA: ATP-binding protein [Anaerolineaceae bacterium]|nr:ATP-binding protein [Anaerolineaceae bacterium]